MQSSAVKTLPFILFALAMLALAGCNGTTVAMSAEYLGITGTKPAPLPPADTADQIAAHESWCYETLGYPECYSQPQNVDPNRLINVDPANRYPMTVFNYNQALAGQETAVKAQ